MLRLMCTMLCLALVSGEGRHTDQDVSAERGVDSHAIGKEAPLEIVQEGKRAESNVGNVAKSCTPSVASGEDMNPSVPEPDAEVCANDFKVSYVTELDPTNFNEFTSEGNAFVRFYAPYSGHCRALGEKWHALSHKLRETDIKMGQINGVLYPELHKIFDKTGLRFPIVLYFTGGKFYVDTNMQNLQEFVMGGYMNEIPLDMKMLDEGYYYCFSEPVLNLKNASLFDEFIDNTDALVIFTHESSVHHHFLKSYMCNIAMDLRCGARVSMDFCQLYTSPNIERLHVNSAVHRDLYKRFSAEKGGSISYMTPLIIFFSGRKAYACEGVCALDIVKFAHGGFRDTQPLDVPLIGGGEDEYDAMPSKIVEGFSQEDFHKFISEKPAFVRFSSSSGGVPHRLFTPKWQKLSKVLEQYNIRVADVADVDAYGIYFHILIRYARNIRVRNPDVNLKNILIYFAGGKAYVYEGERTVQKIVEFATLLYRFTVPVESAYLIEGPDRFPDCGYLEHASCTCRPPNYIVNGLCVFTDEQAEDCSVDGQVLELVERSPESSLESSATSTLKKLNCKCEKDMVRIFRNEKGKPVVQCKYRKCEFGEYILNQQNPCACDSPCYAAPMKDAPMFHFGVVDAYCMYPAVKNAGDCSVNGQLLEFAERSVEHSFGEPTFPERFAESSSEERSSKELSCNCRKETVRLQLNETTQKMEVRCGYDFASMPSRVISLQPENFDEFVSEGIVSEELLSEGKAFVRFFAPWSGHDRHSLPTWTILSNMLYYHDIRVVDIDGTTVEGEKLHETFGRKGMFPTLIFCVGGRRVRKNLFFEYKGKRDTRSLGNFALEGYKDRVPLDMPVQDEHKKAENIRDSSRVVTMHETPISSNCFHEYVSAGKTVVRFYLRGVDPGFDQAYHKVSHTLASIGIRTIDIDITEVKNSEKILRKILPGDQFWPPSLLIYTDGKICNAGPPNTKTLEKLKEFTNMYDYYYYVEPVPPGVKVEDVSEELSRFSYYGCDMSGDAAETRGHQEAGLHLIELEIDQNDFQDLLMMEPRDMYVRLYNPWKENDRTRAKWRNIAEYLGENGILMAQIDTTKYTWVDKEFFKSERGSPLEALLFFNEANHAYEHRYPNEWTNAGLLAFANIYVKEKVGLDRRVPRPSKDEYDLMPSRVMMLEYWDNIDEIIAAGDTFLMFYDFSASCGLFWRTWHKFSKLPGASSISIGAVDSTIMQKLWREKYGIPPPREENESVRGPEFPILLFFSQGIIYRYTGTLFELQFEEIVLDELRNFVKGEYINTKPHIVGTV